MFDSCCSDNFCSEKYIQVPFYAMLLKSSVNIKSVMKVFTITDCLLKSCNVLGKLHVHGSHGVSIVKVQ